MIYTVRYCHLQRPGYVSKGDTVYPGQALGKMGNTGASKGAHLHIDCIHGCHTDPWSLADMEAGRVNPSPRQLNYFIDDDLFSHKIIITTPYNDPDYMIETGKVHLAYDVVPEDRRETENHYILYWNRSAQGTVISSGYDDAYGYYIHITFDA